MKITEVVPAPTPAIHAEMRGPGEGRAEILTARGPHTTPHPPPPHNHHPPPTNTAHCHQRRAMLLTALLARNAISGLAAPAPWIEAVRCGAGSVAGGAGERAGLVLAPGA